MYNGLIFHMPDGTRRYHGLYFTKSSLIFDYPGLCYITIFKWHNHRYDLEYFFYDSKNIGHDSFKSIKELKAYVQSLLDKNAQR